MSSLPPRQHDVSGSAVIVTVRALLATRNRWRLARRYTRHAPISRLIPVDTHGRAIHHLHHERSPSKPDSGRLRFTPQAGRTAQHSRAFSWQPIRTSETVHAASIHGCGAGPRGGHRQTSAWTAHKQHFPSVEGRGGLAAPVKPALNQHRAAVLEADARGLRHPAKRLRVQACQGSFLLYRRSTWGVIHYSSKI